MSNASPALSALLDAHPGDWVWGQALVQRLVHGFALRHVCDRNQAEAQLRLVRAADLRALAQNSAHGEYRPLKSAPDLVNGWHTHVATTGELELALNALYPGSVADWHAAQAPSPPVTSYREFTARQSGMYRITAMLSDAQAARMIRATCTATACLKRRLWTVDGLPPDDAEAKSAIPCLEPCALLLEFARKVMRIEQEPSMAGLLRPSEAASVLAALDVLLTGQPPAGERIADFSSPKNVCRLRLLRENLTAALGLAPSPNQGEE